MECPGCQTSYLSGQKFCGACGHKLEATCAQCGAHNPPNYKFCGQCGSSLSMAGVIILAHSGLITQVNQKALDLLGFAKGEMQGKPFSLFVEREDLVIFFSHLNELHSSSEKQSFKITLNHAEGKSICALLECSVDNRISENLNEIQILLRKVTDKRRTSAQIQHQQDLLNLIFAVTNNICSVSKKHLNIAIEDALKKIGLFAEADHCFIYGINRRLKRLEPCFYWCQPASLPSDNNTELRSISLAMIKRTIVRLRRTQTYIINNVAKLAPSERYELLAWHQIDLGAVMCQLIYAGKRPIGVIGMAKNTADGHWAPDCVALVKFFGQLIADRLPSSVSNNDAVDPLHPAAAAFSAHKKRVQSEASANVIDISAKRPQPHETSEVVPAGSAGKRSKENPRSLPDMTRPMLLKKLSGRLGVDQQTVFPRDDSLFLLTCPRCGLQESVSVNQFNRLGNAISVHCPCRKQFTAVIEKRRSFRKSVRLDGYFSLKGDLGPVGASGSIWGPIVVKDLSKSGLRFSSEKADLVHPDDLLMVRFNLDNSNQALIHKPARVISVTGKEVGCRFEGSDHYDITLGFYFI